MTRTSATFQLVPTNVGNNGAGVRNVTPDGEFIRSTPMTVRKGCVCVYTKFNLEAKSQQSSCEGNGTHVKDAKNPVEVQPPGGNRLFIVLRMITPKDRILFTSLGDIPLDPVRSPK